MLVKALFFIFVLVLSLTGFVKTALANPTHFCTREHMARAIALNQERLPLYEKLTDGKSLAISQMLISMEYGLLITSPAADLSALIFQIAGVPLPCAEYVSMDTVPAFKAEAAKPWPYLNRFQNLDVASFKIALTRPLSTNNFAQVLEISKRALHTLSGQPAFNCLTRHFVESIARAAALAPKQNALSLQRLKISSLGISRQFILSHFQLLDRAQQIDRRAAPLQTAGIPIICQDVPPIPVP